eukprot:scaffold129244_cov42-Phaeocystis_antarctica.AAC.1
MSYDDCAAAVAQESNTDAPLEINAVLSLQSLVEELGELSVDEALQAPSGEFALQAPSASLQHGASYVGSGVYMRKVAEEDASFLAPQQRGAVDREAEPASSLDRRLPSRADDNGGRRRREAA